jgi:uncharacterized protein YjdB
MKRNLLQQMAHSIIRNVSLTAIILIAAGTGACAQVTTFPWTENFENSSTTRPQWTQIHEVGEMDWNFAPDATTGSYTLSAYEGAMVADFPANSWAGEITKLVSPVLNLGGATSASMSFYYVNPLWDTEQNILKVYYRTSAAGAWTQIAIFNSDVDDWTSSGTINLPNLSATYQIALEGETLYGYSIMVDQLVVNATIPAVPVTGVDVTVQGGGPAEITTAGGTLQLNAVVTPAGANQNVTWSVPSGSGFASVNASGLVTAIANGTATIRATSVENTAIFDEIDITINTPVAVESVVISVQGGAQPEIVTAGGTLQLNATVNPAGANQNVTWSVAAGSQVGSVSSAGLVTAIDNGIMTIRATSVENTAIFDEIDITVNAPVAVESVVISVQGGAQPEIITAGGTLQLNAVVNPVTANQDVTWSVTSGSGFATVSASGLVTATANGTATIRATSIENTAVFDEIDITINAPVEVESVEISTQGNIPSVISVQAGTLQLNAVVNPGGANQAVTWSISAGGSFATINTSGLVTAVANGTATIRATSVGNPALFDEIDVVITGQTLGVDDFSMSTIKLYPNPSYDIATITGTSTIKTIEVYNMLGQQVYAKAINNTDARIDVSAFSAGSYIVRINLENAAETVKLIKQ